MYKDCMDMLYDVCSGAHWELVWFYIPLVGLEFQCSIDIVIACSCLVARPETTEETSTVSTGQHHYCMRTRSFCFHVVMPACLPGLPGLHGRLCATFDIVFNPFRQCVIYVTYSQVPSLPNVIYTYHACTVMPLFCHAVPLFCPCFALVLPCPALVLTCPAIVLPCPALVSPLFRPCFALVLTWPGLVLPCPALVLPCPVLPLFCSAMSCLCFVL